MDDLEDCGSAADDSRDSPSPRQSSDCDDCADQQEERRHKLAGAGRLLKWARHKVKSAKTDADEQQREAGDADDGGFEDRLGSSASYQDNSSRVRRPDETPERYYPAASSHYFPPQEHSPRHRGSSGHDGVQQQPQQQGHDQSTAVAAPTVRQHCESWV